MGVWYYKAALSGGFGGCDHEEWEKCYTNPANEEDALKEAYEEACQEYESYAGMHGLEDMSDLEEEYPEYTEDELWEVYCDLRESWLDYEVQEFPEGVDPND